MQVFTKIINIFNIIAFSGAYYTTWQYGRVPSLIKSRTYSEFCDIETIQKVKRTN